MKREKKNIGYYLFEFLVVFTGVSLAFIFDRVYDNYSEAVNEKEYLQSFVSDIKSDIDALDTLINMNGKNLTSMDSIISKFDSVDKEERQNIQTEMLRIMIAQFTFDNQSSTYESLKYAGNMSIISNQKLRKSIVDLYLRYESMNLIEKVYNDFVSKYIYPIGLENMNLSNGKMIKDMSNDQKFKNIVFSHYFLLKQLNDELIKTNKNCNELIASIETELN